MKEIKTGIYQHNLNNSTTLFVVPNEQTETITLRYIFNRGSVHDPPSQEGITNLVQQLSQKKTASYNSQYQLMRALEEQGVSLGATTHKETHGFGIGLTNQKALSKALKIFNEVVWQPRFTKELLKKEIDLVRQDWAQLKDNPRDWVSLITIKKLWQGSPYAYPPLGDISAIEAVTVDDLVKHHQQIRQNSHLYIGVAGRVKPNVVFDFLAQSYGNRAGLGVLGESGWTKNHQLHTADHKPQTRFTTDTRKTQQANLWMAFPTVGLANNAYYGVDLLSWVIGKGFLSRFFDTIRTKNSLAYYYSGNYLPLKDIGAFVIAGGVPVNKLEKVFTETWRQVRDVQDGGLKDWERQRGFNYYTSNKARSLEQSDNLLSFVLGQYLSRGEILTFEEWKKKLSKIDRENLKQTACEIFRLDRATVGAVGPLSDTAVREAWRKSSRDEHFSN